MDDAWLAQLYAQYGYLVHRRCLQLVRRPEDAEDALQETFLRAKRYGAPREGGATLAWLYTIAQRCCFDLMERSSREPPAEESQLAALEQRGEGSPEDADRRAMLGLALRQLDGKTRTIGVLHFLDGYTQEEVATQTGYSRRTIGKKLQQFEDRIRQLWQARAGLKETR
ncbi:sigma-70 family RNA polymerase sigma factor [Archangium minus]|uniref:Sigma-70 family RNA polymerase sigma factor n=1 Tax=Archangium minus TaxID=83450 RepID=A0ABY9WWW5_9BACT|nr:sigma-70 family RNA polymerase sigma factor [Archangium violaceum]WNG47613.1 sigma-70 family RNA polymerase sigma factor [Archangium minus]